MIDIDDLYKLQPKNEVDQVFHDLSKKRLERRKNYDIDKVLDNLDAVIAELEDEIMKYCK